MDNIKASLDLIQGALNWTKDQWTIFVTGFLIGSFLTYCATSLFSRLRTRPSIDERKRMAFEKEKSKLGRTLDRKKIEAAKRCVRTWNDGIKRTPLHVKIKSDKTSRVILPNGGEKVVPTDQLKYMDEDS